MKIARNLSRPAPHVTRQADIANGSCEAIQKLPIERLVFQLVEDAHDIFVGDEVVTGLAVDRLEIAHFRIHQCDCDIAEPINPCCRIHSRYVCA